jgi:hypothetical protein
MTKMQSSKDFNDFSKMIKAEVSKLQDYEYQPMYMVLREAENKLEEIKTSNIWDTSDSLYFYEQISKFASELAIQAYILSSNAKRNINRQKPVKA